MATAAAIPSIDSKVSKFVAQTQKMLINGKHVEAASGKTFATYNPATGEVLANVAEGDREDINRAVKAARAAFETGPWSRMSPAERGKLIWKLGDLIEKHLEEFAQLESLDNGKPLKVARVADVPLAAAHFHYYAGWATKIEGNTIPLTMAAPLKYLAYYSARTRRRCGSDHSLEFPSSDGCVEAWTGARHCLHRRAETGGANTVIGPASR